MKAVLDARVVVTALVTLLAVQATHAADAPQAQYVVGVSGMVCPTSCTHLVREALKTLPEVEDVSVDFDSKTATITTRAAQVLTREQVHKALKGSGFGVTTFEPRHQRGGGRVGLGDCRKGHEIHEVSGQPQPGS